MIKPHHRDGLCERGYLGQWDVEERERVQEAAQLAWNVLWDYELP